MSYPVTFEADYQERRSRLTVFFRGILTIPLSIWLAVYGIVAYLAMIVAWFAIVITGRFPDGLFRFVAGYIRVASLAKAYGALLCDRYPPFGPTPDDTYPVRMNYAGPLPQYSRLKTFFRSILAIPIVILRHVVNLLLQIGAVGAWFVIVITGKMPRGLFDVLMLANSYIARSDSYIWLLTETYPPFQDEQTRMAGVETAVR